MTRSKRNFLACAVLAPCVLALAAALVARRAAGEASSDALAGFPRVILWAWERPEDLGFLDPRQAGVAYLAATVYLKGERAASRPRLQPLKVAPGATVMAVVRVESDREQPPALSADQRRQVVAAANGAIRDRAVAALQIDFDARESERGFYRDLLFDLRREIDPGVKLSMTALASWCMHDDWLSGLPVDEAVPMLFRMGADHKNVVGHLGAGGDFHAALARHSLGVSTDEWPPLLPRGRRVYVFSPRPWTEQSASKIIEEVSRWQ